jgi:hypothetical protein
MREASGSGETGSKPPREAQIAPSGGGRKAGTAVAAMNGMGEHDAADMPAPAPTIHEFTVFRGMVVVVTIETTDWYSGLVQAAAARVRIEGQN